ncbi:hypothetical protein FNV43_RR22117 [Rhamnella rubrinervis]|uniref:Peptidase C14 caspase domain-containing protein n=1 Tax=Rhamnella rubrinervis TaxID=2594499 RepID=A0A8K0DWF2_9ROSA|nr:hypothetical protein FNV43_RR22117 [Rhamnella rubrinervis]
MQNLQNSRARDEHRRDTSRPTTAGFVSGVRSNKRALLCGVTYNSKKYILRGTVNDVMKMKGFLIHSFGFPEECIRVLTEFEHGEEFIPTKINIQNCLKWLVDGCKSGDSLVFYFSGHGLRQPDFKDDEQDGFDETICPVDFMEKGMILDNDINNYIVKPLKQGVTLHAIIDACHSGTVLDLNHIYKHQSGMWKDNKPPSGVAKGTSGGLAICLSACEDNEVAADTSAMNGAMTYILMQTVKHHGPNMTYENLLKKMTEAIHKANKDRCLTSNVMKKIFRRKIIQHVLA